MRATLLATLLLTTTVATSLVGSPATAGPVNVCVTDPFTFNPWSGDCGPEHSWVEVSYTHSTTHICVNTRIDGDIPFCNPPPPPPPPPTCPTGAVPLGTFDSRQEVSPGFRTTRSYAAFNALPGETFTVSRVPSGNPQFDAQPAYTRLLYLNHDGSCSLASTGSTDDGWTPYFSTLTFVLVGDPEQSLGGTFFLQHRSWDLQFSQVYGVGRNTFVPVSAN